MPSVYQSAVDFEARETAFLAQKDTLTKEPSGDVKKEYYVGCVDKDGWDFVHTELLKSGSTETNVPSATCDCVSDCMLSAPFGVHSLTDSEAATLRNHPKVEYVQINGDAYPGTYKINPDDLTDEGGKDIKIGDDIRPVQIIPKNEDFLYNIANGEVLLDEFGNPLITEVDTLFLPSATMSKSTSVVFDGRATPYVQEDHIFISPTSGTPCRYADLDYHLGTYQTVKLIGGSNQNVSNTVQVGGGGTCNWYNLHQDQAGIATSKVWPTGGASFTPTDASLPENTPVIKLENDVGNAKNLLYVDVSEGIGSIRGAKVGDTVYGSGIPAGTHISDITNNGRIVLNNDLTTSTRPVGKYRRYSGVQKSQRSLDNSADSFLEPNPDNSWNNRVGLQIARHVGKGDPWRAVANAGINSTGVTNFTESYGTYSSIPGTFTADVIGAMNPVLGHSEADIERTEIRQFGDGSGVDVIVGDEDMWYGHIEFINVGAGSSTKPLNYRGGNVLNTGFSTHTATGICDVLDLILDAPYYIDPEWFDGNASRRTTRWDGTVVPTDTAARNWWQNNSTSHRSAKFVSSGSGGSATGNNDFGTVTIPAGYTRAAMNGSNTAYKTGPGYHATPCASQAYGKTHGWAYNANKWHCNVIGSGAVSDVTYWNATQILHQCKPVNPKYGTQDPTISSNSWSYRRTADSSGYYYFRQGTTGSGGVSYSSKPPFMDNYADGKHVYEFIGGAEKTAGDACVNAGVIVCVAASNRGQKLVTSDHPDYNNYNASSANTALSASGNGSTYVLTSNRPGMPAQLGKDNGDGTVTYKTIIVGAIDDDYHQSTKKERRVHYSNVGNAVDCYACGDDTPAAADNRTSTRYDRYDPFYVHSSSTSLESEDRIFGGTSSACPVACGLIATKLQYNRDWTWNDIKQWLNNDVGVVEEEVFYHGPEATTATDTAWTDRNSLQGGKPTVIWDAPTGKEWSELSSGALGNVFFRRATKTVKTTSPVWKVEEQFAEASEVSRTLLGIDRAETQLSLFSNVSSYGIDSDEFEHFTWGTGSSMGSWDSRSNKIYGNRYNSSVTEVTQESGIKLTSFPVQYSFPFGPNWARVGSYDATKFGLYKNFINMGNDLYDIFNDSTIAPYNTYPSDFKNNFLNRGITSVDTSVSPNDVSYTSGITTSFEQIDTWTDNWIEILRGGARFIDPVSDEPLSFGNVTNIIKDYNNKKRAADPSFGGFVEDRDQDNTRPGYNSNYIKFAQLQSRRVFRYQPGRISGFTFGVKSSKESIDGSAIEWGIANNTDQYVFMVVKGNLKIVRRSTIPLDSKLLTDQGLKLTDQKKISNGGRASGDPYDSADHYVIELDTDDFNGDPLTGNGPSGYTLQPDQVTMYKIEFGWYGAIGARFYAYIPTGNGEARWVTIHTLVIENKMEKPCLQDSYFRLVYRVNVTQTDVLREPQFVTKYGASYYIDGGDEGTSQMYSANSGVKKVTGISSESLLALKPKEFIQNSLGDEIENKKLIIPTQLNVSSGALTELKTVVCKGCPGFGHVHTCGVTVGDNGRTIAAGDIIFTAADTMQALNTAFFTEADIGAKIIAPSINNAYIASVDSVGSTPGQYLSAKLEGFTGVGAGFVLGSRDVAGGAAPTNDQVTGEVGYAQTITSPGGTNQVYPHSIKLSQFSGVAVSDFAFTGNKLEIQFTNPKAYDDYGHWADFQIGVTDVKPQVSGTANANAEITGWIRDITTGIVDAATLVPTKNEMVYGSHSHQWEALDEDGNGVAERWGTSNPSCRMGIDSRIPNLSNPGGGRCSKISFEVGNPQYLESVEYIANKSVDPSTGGPTGIGVSFWLQVKNAGFPNIQYGGGQLAIKTVLPDIDPITGTNKIEIVEQAVTYVGEPISYNQPAPGGGVDTFNFIQIFSALDPTYAALSPNIALAFRPVKATATTGIDMSRLFNYNPFPLYMIFKGMDQATINTISVKETIGDFSRTISPNLFVLPSTNTSITDSGGNAVRGDAPTHYEEKARLSSALVDEQNEQKIRDGYKVIDTVYLGANSTNQIDLTPIFGPDRTVITPDNNNIESTFLIAKRVDGVNDEVDMEATLTYREQ